MTVVHKALRRYRRGYFRLCSHRSHRLRLPCFRGFVSDGYCARHNDTCFHTCS